MDCQTSYMINFNSFTCQTRGIHVQNTVLMCLLDCTCMRLRKSSKLMSPVPPRSYLLNRSLRTLVVTEIRSFNRNRMLTSRFWSTYISVYISIVSSLRKKSLVIRFGDDILWERNDFILMLERESRSEQCNSKKLFVDVIRKNVPH